MQSSAATNSFVVFAVCYIAKRADSTAVLSAASAQSMEVYSAELAASRAQTTLLVPQQSLNSAITWTLPLSDMLALTNVATPLLQTVVGFGAQQEDTLKIGMMCTIGTKTSLSDPRLFIVESNLIVLVPNASSFWTARPKSLCMRGGDGVGVVVALLQYQPFQASLVSYRGKNYVFQLNGISDVALRTTTGTVFAAQDSACKAPVTGAEYSVSVIANPDAATSLPSASVIVTEKAIPVEWTGFLCFQWLGTTFPATDTNAALLSLTSQRGVSESQLVSVSTGVQGTLSLMDFLIPAQSAADTVDYRSVVQLLDGKGTVVAVSCDFTKALTIEAKQAVCVANASKATLSWTFTQGVISLTGAEKFPSSFVFCSKSRYVRVDGTVLSLSPLLTSNQSSFSSFFQVASPPSGLTPTTTVSTSIVIPSQNTSIGLSLRLCNAAAPSQCAVQELRSIGAWTFWQVPSTTFPLGRKMILSVTLQTASLGTMLTFPSTVQWDLVPLATLIEEWKTAASLSRYLAVGSLQAVCQGWSFVPLVRTSAITLPSLDNTPAGNRCIASTGDVQCYRCRGEAPSRFVHQQHVDCGAATTRLSVRLKPSSKSSCVSRQDQLRLRGH
jgi:hypothetical protein